MKVGDTVHNAIWVTGDEHPAMRKDYENQVMGSITELCVEKGFIHGEFKISTHDPSVDLSKYTTEGVPDHIQGSKVQLLVVEAEVVEVVKNIEVGSFVHNLERKDLMKLRKITRDAYVKKFKHFPSQMEVDAIIEEIGPDAAVETLRDT